MNWRESRSSKKGAPFCKIPKGPCPYPNSIYFGPKVPIRDYFGAKVYTTWVDGPLEKQG